MDLSEFRKNQEDLIAKHGYTLVGVFDPEGKEPTFAYSIGLTAFAWPEVIFFGNIRPDFIEAILTDLINHWRADGKVTLGDIDDIIVDYPLRVIEVATDPALEYAAQVTNYFEPKQIRFVQVLWPDKQGVFPNEPGYDNERAQPIVGEVRS